MMKMFALVRAQEWNSFLDAPMEQIDLLFVEDVCLENQIIFPFQQMKVHLWKMCEL